MLKKNLWVIPVLIFFAWAALSDISDKKEREKRKNFRLENTSQALKHIQGKWHGRIYGGSYRAKIIGTKFHLWLDEGKGWKSKPNEIIDFNIISTTYMDWNTNYDKYMEEKIYELEFDESKEEIKKLGVYRIHPKGGVWHNCRSANDIRFTYKGWK